MKVNQENVFPIQLAKHSMDKRVSNKYKVNCAKTERYFKSTIPYMQRKLNDYEKDLKIIISSSSYTNEFYPCGSLVVKF